MPRQPGRRHRLLPLDVTRGLRERVRDRVLHPRRPRARSHRGRSDGGPLMAGWTHTGYAQQILFGPGSIKRLPDLLRTLGVKRALLITTAGRGASDDGAKVRKALGSARADDFAEVESHVPAPLVQKAMQRARSAGIDGVVSFGGGSCADLGKAV